MKIKIRISLYLFIFSMLWSVFSPLHAAEMLTRNMLMLSNINTEARLSSSRVYSIVEAADGAMWISTKNGVDRYNGQAIKNYVLPTDKKYSDASGRTIKLLKDGHQQIYAYDNKGKVYIYNKVLDAFVLQTNLVSILGGSLVVNDLLVDKENNLWVAMDRGLYVLHSNGQGKIIMKGIYVNHIRFVQDQLLVASSKGIYSYSLKTHQAKCRVEGLSVLSSYHDAKAHRIWVGTFRKGVKVLDDRIWRLLSESSLAEIPTVPVRSIMAYDESLLLFGVDGAGVYSYDKKTRQTNLLLNTDGKPGNVLQGNGIYALCRDRSGNLWIGSYSGGVDLAIPMEQSLEYVRHEFLNPQSLLNDGVNAVLEDRDGKVWYATDKGVSVYDERTHRWIHGLYNKVVLTICQTKTGQILAGTYGDGVYEMSADGSARQVYSLENGKLKTNYVYSLFVDSSARLWIGCLDGDLTSVATDGKITYFPVNQVQCIVESTDHKHIAIGTSHGCYLLEGNGSQKIKRFFYPSEFVRSDFNYFVNALAFQDAHRAWIATDGGGVVLYNLRSHQVKRYTTEQGVPSNTVYALAIDRVGRIWMSTDKGLAFFAKGRVTNLNFFKGLEREYSRMAVTQTRAGEMIFGSNYGAVVLAPQFANGLSYSAPLHITRIEVEGLTESEKHLQRLYQMLEAGKVSFSHNENTLKVYFESINYKYQHDVQYQYFLQGYDKAWSNPSDEQVARFVNLPSGHYTLLVKAVARSNGRVLGEKTLEIHVAQPWWNSWWAWLVYFLVLASMAYFGWDYYRERLQRKYYDEKINFFVNTAHNIRTPLSLVLAPLVDLAKVTELSEKARGFLDMAQRNGDKLLRMVTELLDFQKIDQTKRPVHLQNIDLEVFLKSQAEKFRAMASDKQISIEAQLSACLGLALSTDLSMLDLVFENLLSNAVKYTPVGGRIMVNAIQKEKMVEVSVKDTGIGIPKSEMKHIFQSFFRASNAVKSQEMGSGLGLMLTRQLVQRLGGKLSFESEEGKGTTFFVLLPLSEAKPSESTEAVLTNPVEKSPDASITEDDEQREKDTLLFVDDNADLRQYIRMAFSDRYHVVDVGSGEKALEYLKEGICDIVVSDVMMPGMQGDELCRRIKENPDTSWLPVILLTAKAGRDFMIAGLGMGADDYISKPFDSLVLASKIDSMLLNRRRLSQYYLNRSLALVRGEKVDSLKAHPEQPSLLGEQVGTSSESIEEANSLASVEKKKAEENLNPQDQAFVEKATRLVLNNLSDAGFGIDQLCREMAMSRTLFYGKLKMLTGQAPQEFMRLIRLEQAAQFIKQGDSILDVSVKAGFANVKYFSTVFKKHFGVSPSKYQ